MSKARKVRSFPAQAAVTKPETSVPMTPTMQMILQGLEESLANARRLVQNAEERCNHYVVQCAKELNMNHPRFTFDLGARRFIDTPNYQEPKPNGHDKANVVDAIANENIS